MCNYYVKYFRYIRNTETDDIDTRTTSFINSILTDMDIMGLERKECYPYTHY